MSCSLWRLVTHPDPLVSPSSIPLCIRSDSFVFQCHLLVHPESVPSVSALSTRLLTRTMLAAVFFAMTVVHTVTDRYRRQRPLVDTRAFSPLIALLVRDGALTYVLCVLCTRTHVLSDASSFQLFFRILDSSVRHSLGQLRKRLIHPICPAVESHPTPQHHHGQLFSTPSDRRVHARAVGVSFPPRTSGIHMHDATQMVGCRSLLLCKSLQKGFEFSPIRALFSLTGIPPRAQLARSGVSADRRGYDDALGSVSGHDGAAVCCESDGTARWSERSDYWLHDASGEHTGRRLSPQRFPFPIGWRNPSGNKHKHG